MSVLSDLRRFFFPRKNPKPNLGFWSADLSDIELLIDAEKTFDVILQDKDVAQVMTVGDLFELVCRSSAEPPTWQDFKAFVKTHVWQNNTPITPDTEFFDDV